MDSTENTISAAALRQLLDCEESTLLERGCQFESYELDDTNRNHTGVMKAASETRPANIHGAPEIYD